MSGSVTVSFVQQDGDENGRRVHSAAAEWRCREYIASHPNTDFSVTVNGSLTNPCIEVKFQDALLEQLPVLADVHHSAESNEHVKLPCSVWALVSLLIFVKGDVSVKQWFEGKLDRMDKTLPAHTLQVADFMGCTRVSTEIMKWLSDVTNEVVQSFHDQHSDFHHPLTERVASLTKVLLNVPATCFKAVAQSIVCKCKANPDLMTVGLPTPLLMRWIVASASDVNLCGLTLNPSQWAALAAAVAQSPPGALQKLGITTVDVFQCNYSKNFANEDTGGQQMLDAMQVILPHTPCLTELRLFELVVSDRMLRVFEQMVCMVPCSLVCLVLKFCGDRPDDEKAARLFASIARIKSLKKLGMSQWQQLVGRDAEKSTAPLLSLPDLKIFVKGFKAGDPEFPSGLNIQEWTI